jgi:hypothetical protein
MKIDFLRTGGFAGLRLALELDTSAMDPKDASEIGGLLQEAGFYRLPDHLASTTQGRDRYKYRLRVYSSASKYRQVVVDEDSVPDELLPLLTRLTALALKQSPP